MKSLNHIDEAVFLIVALLVFSGSVLADEIDLSAGEIKEANVFLNQESERWVGAVGDSYRGEDAIKNRSIGEIIFIDSQAGDVREIDIQGLGGGGYYFAAVPYSDENINISRVRKLDNLSLLDKGELFSKKYYPDFYPNYNDYFDAPDETFNQTENITLAGKERVAAKTILNDNVPYYLLRYETETDGIQPLFVAPIDGKKWGSQYSSCYDGDACNFELILPKINESNSENSFQLSLLARGEVVASCSEVTVSETTYIDGIALEGQKNSTCASVKADNSTLDFANSVLEGDNNAFGSKSNGTCGLEVTGDNVLVRKPDVNGYSQGVCFNDSTGGQIRDGGLGGNDVSVAADNSSLTVRNTNLTEEGWGIKARNSGLVEAEKLSFSDVKFSGTLFDAAVESLDNTPTLSEGVVNGLSSLNLSVNVTSVQSSSYVHELGFFYPPVNDSGVEPKQIYKVGKNSSYNSSDPEENKYIADELDVKADPERRYIYFDNNITSFSFFQVFGEKVQPEENTVVETVTEEEEVPGQIVPDAANRFPPQPEPIKLDLSAQDELIIRQNQTKEIDFQVTNYGKVDTESFRVETELGEDWRTGSNRFENLGFNSSTNGTLLAKPLEAETGNLTAVIKAVKDNRSILDYETVDIQVLPLREAQEVQVVEMPRFLDFEEDSEEQISIMVENTGDYDLDSLTVSTRNMEKCINTTSDTYSVEREQQKPLELEIETVSQPASCQGIVVFRENSEPVGFAALSVSVAPSPEESGFQVLPLLIIIWTAFTVYEVLFRG